MPGSSYPMALPSPEAECCTINRGLLETVLFEVKPGPFDPKTDKEFAPWAPAEGSAEDEMFMSQLLSDNS